MHTVEKINALIMLLFFICYSYQFVYIVIGLLSRRKKCGHSKINRLAVLIAARNEEAVIGNLIDSIKDQSYPSEYVDIYVGADNCTDNTASIAREHGAAVFERKNLQLKGKGYVLNFLLRQIKKLSSKKYDAYIVLDADNVLDSNFITEINRSFCDGYDIVTCYRNSKNYGDNWISAGYALWFLREARYLNGARSAAGSSCAVSGTGFLFSDKILEACGGWNFFLLTEDIEFTVHNVVRGVKIGYAPGAVIYDEQPTSFSQSWHQRLRWAKGYLQVFRRYGRELISGIFHGSFSCYDMAMNIMPAAILTGLSVVINLGAAIYAFSDGGSMAALSISIAQTLLSLYLTLFAIGGITTATEWRNIYCPGWKKVLYAFTFPFFMLTYIPICAASLFAKPEWKPIRHSRCLTLQQLSGASSEKCDLYQPGA